MSKKLIYQNYHKHSMYTNIRVPDSVERMENYAQKAVELGHGIISSVEHGWQGRYIESYELAKKYNLKFLFGTEAYWVKDRFEKDKTNAHICLLAKNENGRQSINRILSEANINGYYYQPRIDINLIMSLPKDDVWVTTACVAGWKYGQDSLSIFKKFHKHFGDNFMFEVQYHNTQSQIDLNKMIYKVADAFGANLIMGCDSHFVNASSDWERDAYLKSKGITYEDENGWYLDYVDGDIAYERFARQNALTESAFMSAIENTNILLNVEEYSHECFTKNIKMPTLYPDLSQNDKDIMFVQLVSQKWEEEKYKIPREKWDYYLSEIKKEVNDIIITKHADYFLLDYELVKLGVKNGGIITPSGRGCFTSDALVVTQESLKPINQVKIDDYVLDENGQFKRVLDTLQYNIEEEMIKITHMCEIDTNYPTICTKDHKILVYRNNKTQYIEAQNITEDDYVCCPKVYDGYNCKESYKIKHNSKPYDNYKKKNTALQDDKYWYLPVWSVEKIPSTSTHVYDLTIEDSHSFVINNMVVHNSGVSFFLNKLLGFTKIDRISSPVKMYPERFISSTRILESKSLADLDLNLANPSVFADAQVELLGDGHSAPMIAYGTMKPKNAWKMYARANEVNFDTANFISAQIDKYEEDLKYHNEDETDEELNVLDYIDEQYHDVFLKSAQYLGTISDGKQHPCAFLIYQGDIPSEIGLVRLKENVCTVVDGKWAEDYKFLKNDLLKVASIQLIYRVFERINKEIPDVNELIQICKDNPKVWDIYKNGYVLGINQVEKPATQQRAKKYAPQNISELCAFIAAIRPGFKSMYKTFEDRIHFDYGIPTFDKLIQTDEMPHSFVLYQEQAMATLNYAGIPMTECYDIIKAISKKRVDKIKSYKDTMLRGFSEKIQKDSYVNEEHANELALQVWQILEDSSRYSFNASHSFSMAVDSLYGAYLKTMYPLEFYEVFLNLLMERGEKDRANKAKQEALDGFGIKIEQFRFRQDNRKFTIIEGTNSLSDSLQSIKGFGFTVAEELYKLKDNHYNTFIDLLIDLQNTTVNETQIENLIVLKYFDEFGKNKKLLGVYEYFKRLYGRSQIKIDEITKYGISEELILKYVNKQTAKLYKGINVVGLLNEISSLLSDEYLDIKTQLIREVDILEYVKSYNPNYPADWYYVVSMRTFKNPLKPYVALYSVHDGTTISTKIKDEKLFSEEPFKEFSMLSNVQFKEAFKYQNVNDKWVKTTEKELILSNYRFIS